MSGRSILSTAVKKGKKKKSLGEEKTNTILQKWTLSDMINLSPIQSDLVLAAFQRTNLDDTAQ